MEGNNVKVFSQIWNIYPEQEPLSILCTREIKIFFGLNLASIYMLPIQIFFPDQEGRETPLSYGMFLYIYRL